MTIPTPPRKLTQSAVEAVRAAALLVTRCDGFWRDEYEVQQGWTIDYAVDVDVVTLFQAPKEKSHYARVFDLSEDASSSELLARMVGEFIFRRLECGELLLIPPHDAELQSVHLATAHHAVQKNEKAKQLLESIIDKIVAKNPQEIKTLLSEVVDAKDLIEAFDGQSGPRSELDRFRSLPRNRIRNIFNVESYRQNDGIAAQEKILPPRGDVASAARDEFVVRIGRWRERLKGFQSGRQRASALLRDAIVLASLEWINSRLLPLKRRLALVTGSDYLFRAAATVTIGSNSNFAEDFLRHPLAFVAHRDFFVNTKLAEPAAEIPFSLADWANLFFPSALRKNSGYGISVDRRLLAQIAEGKDSGLNQMVTTLANHESHQRGAVGFPNDLLEMWTSVITAAANRQSFSAVDTEWATRVANFITGVNERLHKGWTIAEFHAELDRRLRNSLSGFYLYTARFGVLTEPNLKIRGLPALRFDKPYEKAQKISAELIQRLFKSSSQLGVERLYEELQETDATNYHAHVIHALAFAGKGHWFATRTLCEIALLVVDDIPTNQKNGRDGREAAYLLAVTERRIARFEADILNKAQPALGQSKKRAGTDAGVMDDVRFNSEEYAQEVTLLQFRIFAGGATVDQLSRTSIELQSWLGRAVTIMDKALEKHKKDNLGEIKNWVLRQTATNSLIVAILAEAQLVGAVSQSPSLEVVRKIIHRTGEEGLAPIVIDEKRPLKEFRDTVSDFVFCVAIALFGKTQTQRANAHMQVRDTNDLGAPPLPFEQLRMDLFKRIVEDALR